MKDVKVLKGVERIKPKTLKIKQKRFGRITIYLHFTPFAYGMTIERRMALFGYGLSLNGCCHSVSIQTDSTNSFVFFSPLLHSLCSASVVLAQSEYCANI